MLAATVSAAPAPSAEPTEPTAVSMEMTTSQNTDIVITVSGRNVRVQNGLGEEIHIYDVTGSEVFTGEVDSTDKIFTTNLKFGCYIVKVGKTVRKISVR